MTYPIIATSVDSAKSIYLYEFKMSVRSWRYTNVDSAQTYISQVYSPLAISHDDRESSGDASQGGLTLNVPGDNVIASLFEISPPSERISLTVYHLYGGDDDIRVVWKGRVLAVEWGDDSFANLTCESVFASLQQTGVRRRCQANCPFMLYGTQCGVSSALHQQVVTPFAIAGNKVTISAAVGTIDNHYAGGSLSWLNSMGIRERRMVKQSVGATGVLTLTSYPVDLTTGTSAILLPGCDHTLTGVNGCGKFNNKPRYGGFAFMPTKKPFSGSTLY